MSNINELLKQETYTFTFGGRTYDVAPGEDIPIDEFDLSTEFANQASKYAYIAILNAKADNAVKLSKIELEEKESEVYGKVRKSIELSGQKPTEGMINNEVNIHLDVMNAKRNLVKKQADLSILDALETAYKMRADMIGKLGNMQQSEQRQDGMQKKDPRYLSTIAKEAFNAAKSRDGKDS